MEKAFDFLSKHKDVAFATVEGDKRKIGVFPLMGYIRMIGEHLR